MQYGEDAFRHVESLLLTELPPIDLTKGDGDDDNIVKEREDLVTNNKVSQTFE